MRYLTLLLNKAHSSKQDFSIFFTIIKKWKKLIKINFTQAEGFDCRRK